VKRERADPRLWRDTPVTDTRRWTVEGAMPADPASAVILLWAVGLLTALVVIALVAFLETG